jgi:hypothetical protein
MLFDRDDGVVTLCEIKYTKDSFIIDKSYAENLKNKREIFKTQTLSKKQLQLVFITNNGLKDNAYGNELVDQIITLNDFFTNF